MHCIHQSIRIYYKQTCIHRQMTRRAVHIGLSKCTHCTAEYNHKRLQYAFWTKPEKWNSNREKNDAETEIDRGKGITKRDEAKPTHTCLMHIAHILRILERIINLFLRFSKKKRKCLCFYVSYLALAAATRGCVRIWKKKPATNACALHTRNSPFLLHCMLGNFHIVCKCKAHSFCKYMKNQHDDMHAHQTFLRHSFLRLNFNRSKAHALEHSNSSSNNKLRQNRMQICNLRCVCICFLGWNVLIAKFFPKFQFFRVFVAVAWIQRWSSET